MLCPRGLSDELTPALADELPLLARDGGFIRQGYDLALDNLRGLRDERVAMLPEARVAGDIRFGQRRLTESEWVGRVMGSVRFPGVRH